MTQESKPVKDPTALVEFHYEMDCGVTVAGTLPRQQYERLIRDPSELNKTIDPPPFTAVKIVLPASCIVRLSEKDI